MDHNKPFDYVAELAALSEWNFKRQARIEELEAELAEARKDGERYRANWLVLLTATGEDCHLRALEMISAARAAEAGKG